MNLFLISSMVEQRAVNSHVVGSSPASGAKVVRSLLTEGQTQDQAKKIKINPVQF
jgi:hypothetical protein